MTAQIQRHYDALKSILPPEVTQVALVHVLNLEQQVPDIGNAMKVATAIAAATIARLPRDQQPYAIRDLRDKLIEHTCSVVNRPVGSA